MRLLPEPWREKKPVSSDAYLKVLTIPQRLFSYVQSSDLLFLVSISDDPILQEQLAYTVSLSF